MSHTHGPPGANGTGFGTHFRVCIRFTFVTGFDPVFASTACVYDALQEFH